MQCSRLILLVTALTLLASVGCRNESSNEASDVTGATAPAIVAEATPMPAPTVTVGNAVDTSDFEPQAPLVNWSDAGVTVRDISGDLQVITSEPTTSAVLFDDGLVAYQATAEQITVIGEGIDREIRAGPEQQLRLLDARDSSGSRQLLVSTRPISAVSPDEAQEVLLLIDADSGERYELGAVGAWESGVDGGRFTDNAVAVLWSSLAGHYLMLFDDTGELRHDIMVATDASVALAAFPTGDDLALFRDGVMTLVDASTGELAASVAGSWPCASEAQAGATGFYCEQDLGERPVWVSIDTQATTSLEWTTQGAVAPATAQTTGTALSSMTSLLRAPGLRQVAVSPDGQFRYFMYEEWPATPSPVLVDDGSGLRPAMSDLVRALYRLSPLHRATGEIEFLDDTTVAWTSAATATMNEDFMGRIDDRGMILDIAGPFFDPDLEAYEPFAVMTSGADLGIDETKPLAELMSEPDSPVAGGWFVGNTLATEPACGEKTLYRTTADGYGRVLPAGVELDEPVAITATGVYDGLNIDAVSTHRAVAISVACPGEYEGVRVHLLVETLSYGDGGPGSGPFTRLLGYSALQLVDGTETFAGVTGISAVGRDCGGAMYLDVGLTLLGGQQVVLNVPEWFVKEAPLSPSGATSIRPDTGEIVLCESG